MDRVRDRHELDVLPAWAAPGQPALAGIARLRPRRRLWGYRRDPVDRMLESLAARYAETERERAELRIRVERLDGALARLLELERSAPDPVPGARPEAEAMHEQAPHATFVPSPGAAREPDTPAGGVEDTVTNVRALVEEALERLDRGSVPAGHENAGVEAPAGDIAGWREDVDSPTGVPFAEPSAAVAEAPAAGLGRAGRLGGPYPSPWVLVLSVAVAGVLGAAAYLQFATDRGVGADRAAPAASATTAAVQPSDPSPAAVAPAVAEPAAPAATAQAEAPPTAPPMTLVVRATGGESWILVRAGSATGKVLYEGILADGASERFTGKQLWLRMGSPSTLGLKLNGKPVSGLPNSVADVLVTPDGVETLALG